MALRAAGPKTLIKIIFRSPTVKLLQSRLRAVGCVPCLRSFRSPREPADMLEIIRRMNYASRLFRPRVILRPSCALIPLSLSDLKALARFSSRRGRNKSPSSPVLPSRIRYFRRKDASRLNAVNITRGNMTRVPDTFPAARYDGPLCRDYYVREVESLRRTRTR